MPAIVYKGIGFLIIILCVLGGIGMLAEQNNFIGFLSCLGASVIGVIIVGIGDIIDELRRKF